MISELFQDCRETVRRFEALRLAFRRLEFPQAALLHLQVQFDVVVRGGWRFMAQQQRDDHDVNVRLQQAHGRGVADGVRRDGVGFERGAVLGSPLHDLA